MKFICGLCILLIGTTIAFAQDFVGEKNKISVQLTAQIYLQENIEFFDKVNGVFYTGSNIYASTNMPP